ncbi:unnamed protein product [Cladocopium goreaui]|uniref:Uncharacterized protein n=1 Tax=Cladocopium goreaui TaxID=2562237 RepID=A0A9P1DAL3_9DINO|nr:unnamed protein product [Cladocopium goreaui]|mmetsp:Transcript_63646/g.139512  ORF Transcript_63646/g.139512 Transcript_63646/m.139512 type:complete len:251 (-) Transcript_63646:24-776(-)
MDRNRVDAPMHAPRAMGLPPAVARIFEKADRLEPLFAHRAQKGKRLGPLPPQPIFPERIDLESRPPRHRGASWDFQGEDSPGKTASDEQEALEATREAELFSQSYPHPSFLEGPPVPMAMRMVPQPPMGSRSPRKQRVARSDVLAEMVYSAPVVPGLQLWPRKRRPLSLPRRTVDARAQASTDASNAGGQTARKRPGLTFREKEAQRSQTQAAVTEDLVAQVIESAVGHFICDNLLTLGFDDGLDLIEPV